MQHLQHLFVVFSKVLTQHSLVDAFEFDDVLCDGVGSVLVDEALGNVVCDCVFWLFVEHEDEELSLLGELLVLANVVQLGHQLPILVLILVQNTLHRHVDRLAVLLQIVLHLLLELCPPLFCFSADNRMPEATIR